MVIIKESRIQVYFVFKTVFCNKTPAKPHHFEHTWFTHKSFVRTVGQAFSSSALSPVVSMLRPSVWACEACAPLLHLSSWRALLNICWVSRRQIFCIIVWKESTRRWVQLILRICIYCNVNLNYRYTKLNNAVNWKVLPTKGG